MAVIPALLLTSLISASEVAPEPAQPAMLEEVVVSGAQPGPGLWRVERDGHELWILGTLTPLPRKMQWVADEVQETVARSQEVVLGPQADLRMKGGALRGLFLLPAALGARNNPDDAKLVDVVPAADYARWTVLKAKHIGRSKSVEKRRPIFAAWRLYEEALEDSGLSLEVPVAKVVERAAKRNDVPLTRPEISIMLDKPGETLKDFARNPLDDLGCFRGTMDQVEKDLGTLQARANAWATGDFEAMRSLDYTDPSRECLDAVLEAGFARRSGIDDLEQRLRDAWLESIESALGKNDTSFAILPMSLLLRDDGWLAPLRERGYAIETPWEREARELGSDDGSVADADEGADGDADPPR